MSERFIVAEVTGYTIRPDSTAPYGNSKRALPRSFTVLDSGYCYRIVGEFNTDSDSALGTKGNEVKAHALCDRLNRWDSVLGSRPVAAWSPS
jgi:hypothetical protein